MALPLDGVLVLALEQAVAAPFATRQLADLGARVIKIERPAVGDFARSYDSSVAGQSSYFVWLNRGKESVTLDLTDPASLEIMRSLVAKADVFVHNLAPGAVERLGLGVDSLAEDHPQLITCGISGYGADGPWRDRKAYDLLLQCETGLVSITGTPGVAAKVGISIADIAAGMYAYSGILTALLERTATGRGRGLAVSLLDSLGEWMSAPALMTAGSGTSPRPAGLAHATIAPYGPYETQDGVVMLAVQNEREFKRLATQVLGVPELAVDPRFADNSARVENREELNTFINRVASTLCSREFAASLEDAGIANANVNDIAGFIDHPQLEARDRWRPVPTPAGDVSALMPAVIFEGLDLPMRAVPGLGDHTDSVLREMNVSPQTASAMRQRGAI